MSGYINIKNMEREKNIIVSDDFIETYKYLNAVDMTTAINSLDTIERYLLVTLALDNHDIKNDIVKKNLLPLKDIGQAIYDAMEEIDSDNQIIKKIIEMTDDKYINVNVLIDSNGNKMPEPANISEIREYKLRFID
jgi:hypothetical protein